MTEASIPDRVVFNGRTPLFVALLVTAVFGGIALFGLYVVTVAISVGEAGSWFFFGILAVVIVLFWAVLGVLWSALGVWMIVTPDGVRTYGAFGSRSYPSYGLRAGLFETLASRTGNRSRVHKRQKITQLWLQIPGAKPRKVSEAPLGDPLHSRIVQAFDHVMIVPVITLSRAENTLALRPDFSVFEVSDDPK